MFWKQWHICTNHHYAYNYNIYKLSQYNTLHERMFINCRRKGTDKQVSHANHKFCARKQNSISEHFPEGRLKFCNFPNATFSSFFFWNLANQMLVNSHVHKYFAVFAFLVTWFSHSISLQQWRQTHFGSCAEKLL